MTRIYTRTGDKGTTTDYLGNRSPKNTPLFQFLGDLDECSAAIGLSLSLFHREHPIKNRLAEVQQALFDLGGFVAGAKVLSHQRFDAKAVTQLEHWIDEMEEELEPLKTFILPGGAPAASALQLARTICRRAERSLVDIQKPEAVIYLNRLSDFLFVAARLMNKLEKGTETKWEKPSTAE